MKNKLWKYFKTLTKLTLVMFVFLIAVMLLTSPSDNDLKKENALAETKSLDETEKEQQVLLATTCRPIVGDSINLLLSKFTLEKFEYTDYKIGKISTVSDYKKGEKNLNYIAVEVYNSENNDVLGWPVFVYDALSDHKDGNYFYSANGIAETVSSWEYKEVDQDNNEFVKKARECVKS